MKAAFWLGTAVLSAELRPLPSGNGQVMPCSVGQAAVLADHALGGAAGTGNALKAQARFILEAQDLDDVSHGNLLCRDPPFLVMRKEGVCRIKFNNDCMVAVTAEEADRGFAVMTSDSGKLPEIGHDGPEYANE